MTKIILKPIKTFFFTFLPHENEIKNIAKTEKSKRKKVKNYLSEKRHKDTRR